MTNIQRGVMGTSVACLSLILAYYAYDAFLVIIEGWQESAWYGVVFFATIFLMCAAVSILFMAFALAIWTRVRFDYAMRASGIVIIFTLLTAAFEWGR